jgi:hypothetical protein
VQDQLPRWEWDHMARWNASIPRVECNVNHAPHHITQRNGQSMCFEYVTKRNCVPSTTTSVSLVYNWNKTTNVVHLAPPHISKLRLPKVHSKQCPIAKPNQRFHSAHGTKIQAYSSQETWPQHVSHADPGNIFRGRGFDTFICYQNCAPASYCPLVDLHQLSIQTILLYRCAAQSQDVTDNATQRSLDVPDIYILCVWICSSSVHNGVGLE